jgi:hypothetical protein
VRFWVLWCCGPSLCLGLATRYHTIVEVDKKARCMGLITSMIEDLLNFRLTVYKCNYKEHKVVSLNVCIR